MNRILPVALAVTVSAFSHAVTAQQGGATASLTNIQLTLIDLAPFDGISPSFSFFGTAYTLVARSPIHSNNAVSTLTLYTDTMSLEDQVEAESVAAYSIAAADLNALLAESAFSGFQDFYSAASSTFGAPPSSLSPNVRLGPKSALRINADASLEAQRSLFCSPPLECGFYGRATAEAEMKLLPGSGLTSSAAVDRSITVSTNGTQTLDEVLGLVLYNYSFEQQVGTLSMRARTSVAGFVPEPETWALAGAGLLVTGWLSARRGRRAA